MSAIAATGATADREITCTTLPAPSVPASVRSILEQRIALLGLDKVISEELRCDILLAVSELVANACDATPCHEITFRVVFEDRSVWIGVWDASNEQPRPKAIVELGPDDITPDPNALDEGYISDDIGGWGLPLVMGLTKDRNVSPTPPEGKWVWARFHFPAAEGRPACSAEITAVSQRAGRRRDAGVTFRHITRET
jgi:anti-sigma regulatory factor (Ser/Thr protein kinase)